MTRTEQRLADLERLMAEQVAEMGRLREQACVVRTLQEMALMHAGYPADPGRARCPRHLRLVSSAS